MRCFLSFYIDVCGIPSVFNEHVCGVSFHFLRCLWCSFQESDAAPAARTPHAPRRERIPQRRIRSGNRRSVDHRKRSIRHRDGFLSQLHHREPVQNDEASLRSGANLLKLFTAVSYEFLQ
jgi:hypothetical protein